jgi:hypothetical protein
MTKASRRTTTKVLLIWFNIFQKETNILPKRSGLGADGIEQAETGSI